MESQSRTTFFMFVVLLGVLAYDAFAVRFYGTPSSVSQWIADTVGMSALQLIGSGIFIDHFLGWTMKRNRVQCPVCRSVFEIQTGKIITTKNKTGH